MYGHLALTDSHRALSEKNSNWTDIPAVSCYNFISLYSNMSHVSKSETTSQGCSGHHGRGD